MATNVGILSMQRIKNYGSFLQAYGLKHILEEMGCEVQFVDYHPGETLVPSDGGKGLARKISKVTDVLRQGGPLKEKIRFINYKKNYAKNYYPYLGIDDSMNFNPEVDVLVIGSDEVFNCVQNNTNVGFCPELFGQERKAKILISYAASFGNTTEKKLSQYGVKEKVAGWLKEFDAISVRDKNSEEIVKSITGINPINNLDPVLMYEFKDIPSIKIDNNYLILYGYSGRFKHEECKKIREYANQKGLKIYCIGGVQYCCDKFIDVNPFEVIAYFMNAECVITDTFHGTILSIISHRRFVSMIRNEGYGNSQKLVDLLERLKLSDRKLNSIDELNKIDKMIDYKEIDEVIEFERKKTRSYLKQWVK